MTSERGKRTKAEDIARSYCRQKVHSLGSRLRKIGRNHVEIEACETWPQGLVTAFHGWVDLQERIELCSDEPQFVIDGYYIRGQEEMPRDHQYRDSSQDNGGDPSYSDGDGRSSVSSDLGSTRSLAT